MTVPASIWEQVRERAERACEFCGVNEIDAAGELTVDHFRPKQREGSDDLSNLIYCCFRCNIYKAAYWQDDPGLPQLWNPRQESRDLHLVTLDDGSLYPASLAGRFTIERLRLNRPQLIDYRRRKLVAARVLSLLKTYEELTAIELPLLEQEAELSEAHRALLQDVHLLIKRLNEGS